MYYTIVYVCVCVSVVCWVWLLFSLFVCSSSFVSPQIRIEREQRMPYHVFLYSIFVHKSIFLTQKLMEFINKICASFEFGNFNNLLWKNETTSGGQKLYQYALKILILITCSCPLLLVHFECMHAYYYRLNLFLCAWVAILCRDTTTKEGYAVDVGDIEVPRGQNHVREKCFQQQIGDFSSDFMAKKEQKATDYYLSISRRQIGI